MPTVSASTTWSCSTPVPSTEESWLKEFLARLAKTKSRVTNINLEFGALTVSAPEPVLRLQAIDLTKRWIDHAAALGCPRVMVNQGALTRESKQVTIAALKLIGAYGNAKRIMVGVENRGAPRSIEAGSVVLIDVRPREEFEQGHIAGAVSVPLDELDGWARGAAKRKQIVAYCRGPYCVYATEAVAKPQKRGLRALRANDGVAEWRAAGLPIEMGGRRA